jgi:hypothetical protein
VYPVHGSTGASSGLGVEWGAADAAGLQNILRVDGGSLFYAGQALGSQTNSQMLQLSMQCAMYLQGAWVQGAGAWVAQHAATCTACSGATASL